MPNIKPFKAVYYNWKKVKDIAKVVSPPYDVISPDEQDYLHNLSPYNFTHIDLGKDLPKDDKTKGLISKNELKKMKPGSFIINAARGGIIVEKDLLEAVDNGAVAGAALDVFENEPDFNKALAANPKIIATPHIGAASIESQERVGVIIVDQILEYLRSKFIFL